GSLTHEPPEARAVFGRGRGRGRQGGHRSFIAGTAEPIWPSSRTPGAGSLKRPLKPAGQAPPTVTLSCDRDEVRLRQVPDPRLLLAVAAREQVAVVNPLT